MKKYIRTNDGIYKTRQCYPEETLFENVTYVYKHEFVKNKDIIAKADTIEELCNEFVIYDGEQNNGLPFTCPKEKLAEIKPYIQICMQKHFNIWLKGAIWTDKGLIYVAKMNDKGELELL